MDKLTVSSEELCPPGACVFKAYQFERHARFQRTGRREDSNGEMSDMKTSNPHDQQRQKRMKR